MIHIVHPIPLVRSALKSISRMHACEIRSNQSETRKKIAPIHVFHLIKSIITADTVTLSYLIALSARKQQLTAASARELLERRREWRKRKFCGFGSFGICSRLHNACVKAWQKLTLRSAALLI